MWVPGGWTLARVATVIRRRLGVVYRYPSSVWNLLHRLGFSAQRPARRAVERDEQKITDWREHIWTQFLGGPPAPTHLPIRRAWPADRAVRREVPGIGRADADRRALRRRDRSGRPHARLRARRNRRGRGESRVTWQASFAHRSDVEDREDVFGADSGAVGASPRGTWAVQAAASMAPTTSTRRSWTALCPTSRVTVPGRRAGAVTVVMTGLRCRSGVSRGTRDGRR
ncbi:helix-turn-helix domain-containing protein [Dactylosporangium maewongense]|uniref:helix-turn-helix domain-containing protein n=1 Tax=Dactylosporangium maewongense TaxID=634393 RepID=UPI003CD0C16B